MMPYHDDSPAVIALKLDLCNIHHYLLTTPPGRHRDQIDRAIKNVFRKWDRLNQEVAA